MSSLARSTQFVVLALVACVQIARADPSLWDAAAQDAESSAREQRYQDAMHAGYELGKTAMAMGLEALRGGDTLPAPQRTAAFNRALQAFRDAAAIDDKAAEPHYYIAQLLTFLRTSCRGCPFELGAANAAVAAMDAFEARAPLDPRLTSMLFSRAILHTQLSGTVSGSKAQAHLEAALADYRALVARSAPMHNTNDEVYGNMAETLMMLGELDEAVEQYRQALRMNPSNNNTLGLAVALDRDERGTEARALVRELGTEGVSSWHRTVADGEAFYVPEGEVYYYRALIAEAFGAFPEAVAGYDRFIRSGANARFAARAAANRDALRARKKP